MTPFFEKNQPNKIDALKALKIGVHYSERGNCA